MDRVHTTWAGIIKHLLDRTSPNIIFIWSGEMILGLGFASPNITLPDEINMILVSVLSSKCIISSPFKVRPGHEIGIKISNGKEAGNKVWGIFSS